MRSHFSITTRAALACAVSGATAMLATSANAETAAADRRRNRNVLMWFSSLDARAEWESGERIISNHGTEADFDCQRARAAARQH